MNDDGEGGDPAVTSTDDQSPGARSSDPSASGRPGTATDAEFTRRLGEVVEWGVEHDVAFDRSWTVRTGADLEYDLMVEFVYLAGHDED